MTNPDSEKVKRVESFANMSLRLSMFVESYGVGVASLHPRNARIPRQL